MFVFELKDWIAARLTAARNDGEESGLSIARTTACGEGDTVRRNWHGQARLIGYADLMMIVWNLTILPISFGICRKSRLRVKSCNINHIIVLLAMISNIRLYRFYRKLLL